MTERRERAPEVHVYRDPRYTVRFKGKRVHFSFNPWYDDPPCVLAINGKRPARQPGRRNPIWKTIWRRIVRNEREAMAQELPWRATPESEKP